MRKRREEEGGGREEGGIASQRGGAAASWGPQGCPLQDPEPLQPQRSVQACEVQTCVPGLLVPRGLVAGGILIPREGPRETRVSGD